MSAGTRSVQDWWSFQRIVDIPFGTCVAALESWQLTGQDGGRRTGQSLLYGPIEHDRDYGTCRVQVRMARGLLRASADEAGHRPLVLVTPTDRSGTHPLQVHPAQRPLLPGRPLPAGLVGPLAGTTLAGAALGQPHRKSATHRSRATRSLGR
jgi:hypothetical protein